MSIKERESMAVYLKSFLAGAAALSLFVLLILGVGYFFVTPVAFLRVARYTTPRVGLSGACLLIFAMGFGWEYLRTSRRLLLR
jgi:hypothetical protein